MATMYGHKLVSSGASGLMFDSARASVYSTMPENGWAHTWHGQVGRTGSTSPIVRGHIWAVAAGVPGALVANTAELTASTLMGSGGSPADLAGNLTAIVPVTIGTQYAIGLATRGAQLMHGMTAAASLSSSYNRNFYNRASVGSTGPYNPMGQTSNSFEGRMTLWVEYDPNVKPSVPLFRAPAGLIPSAPSVFTGQFRDANETVDGRANAAEKLNQYRIQLRVKGDTGPLKWDATYTAITAEQTARAFSRAFSGTGTLDPGIEYEWRCGVSDAHGAWSNWSGWLAFTIGSEGVAGIHLGGGVTGRQTTLTPGPMNVTYSHPNGLGITGGVFQILSGETVIRTVSFTQVVTAGAFTITPPWNAPWPPLDWSQSLSWNWSGNDSDGQPTAWSRRVLFNTNFRPSTPSAISPLGGAVIDGYPMLMFTMRDQDDTVATGLTAEVRVKTAASVLIATRAATQLTETTWGYQTTIGDLADTASYRWDARGRDLVLDGNWSAEADFAYVKAPEVLTPSPNAFVPSSSLSIVYQMTGQVQRRFLLYHTGTTETILVTDWEVTGSVVADLDLSGIIDNGTPVELVIEVEIAGAILTRSTRTPFTVLLDPDHTVALDTTLSGAIAVGNEPDTSAIRLVRGATVGVDANNFVSWRVREGPANWIERWSAIPIPLPEPGLLLPLATNLTGQDAGGLVTASSSGTVTFVSGQALMEASDRIYLPYAGRLDPQAGEILCRFRLTSDAVANAYLFGTANNGDAGTYYLSAYVSSLTEGDIWLIFRNGAETQIIFTSAVTVPLDTDCWLSVRWNGTLVEYESNLFSTQTRTRTLPTLPFTGLNLNIGSLSGTGFELYGRIGPFLTFLNPLTSAERVRAVAETAEAPVEWSEFGDADRARWLQLAAPLASELTTVAESRSFTDTELTFFEPRLGSRPYTYALTAVVKDGVNELESLPVNPIAATFTATAIILSDVANPTGLRVWIDMLLRDDTTVDHTGQNTLVETWSDDPEDALVFIDSGSRYEVISERFLLIDYAAVSPYDAYLALRALRGERPDRTPIAVMLRNSSGERFVGRVTKLDRVRLELGRAEVNLDFTGVRR